MADVSMALYLALLGVVMVFVGLRVQVGRPRVRALLVGIQLALLALAMLKFATGIELRAPASIQFFLIGLGLTLTLISLRIMVRGPWLSAG